MTTSGPKFGVMPSCCNGMNFSAKKNEQRLIARDSAMNTQVAAILPNISWARVTGSASNGSSEPRSRSPAVVSIARYMPPISIAKIKK